MFSNLKKIIYINMFNFLPVRPNKIVFNNFDGKGFGGNPKYVSLKLLKAKKNLDLVWISDDTFSNQFPDGIRVVKKNSIRAIYEMATAKLWINNTRISFKPYKKKKQYYIQTWHGTVDLKKVERQVQDTLDKEYVKEAKRDGKITDVMISSSKYMTERYLKWYWFHKKVLEIGTPRMDIVLEDDRSKKKKIKEKIGIPDDYEVVLYAPTFRDSIKNGTDINNIYDIDYSLLKRTLENKFKDKFIILVRFHPNISNIKDNLNKGLINVTNYGDMQELLLVADVLVTDYSSCMFDMMIANKPVFIYANDYEEYLTRERGFNLDVKSLPAPFSLNNQELETNIYSFDIDSYMKKCKSLICSLGIREDGHASKRLADYILEKIIL